ncbi:PTS system mannose/fructose/N-acetylgalactosamine-transporter subunit IIB [Lapidilactobacillus luobeiensis]|uniref:PTS system mannose/fructose/N-acetylgalactosamine-transporter subunit IIB n=1 Tax=Lapidilactobacillus luobeiensis TaxID=2950371 RepID=UPI0021C42454|nr:PTS sugar transporter subunit IIB [Lapidilactobacillus luobeiensis]
MIEMIRVDDRLIHGQVALLWSKELQINRIIVANDQVATSEIQKNALLLAAPTGIKVATVSVAKAIDLVTDPRSEKLKILIVVNNVDDLLALTENIPVRPKLDIANVGRINGNLKSKQKLTETVYLTDQEIIAVKKVAAINANLVYQPLPNDNPKKFIDLLKGE